MDRKVGELTIYPLSCQYAFHSRINWARPIRHPPNFGLALAHNISNQFNEEVHSSILNRNEDPSLVVLYNTRSLNTAGQRFYSLGYRSNFAFKTINYHINTAECILPYFIQREYFYPHPPLASFSPSFSHIGAQVSLASSWRNRSPLGSSPFPLLPTARRAEPDRPQDWQSSGRSLWRRALKIRRRPRCPQDGSSELEANLEMWIDVLSSWS